MILPVLATFLVGLLGFCWLFGLFVTKTKLSPNKFVPVRLVLKEIVNSSIERPVVFLTFDLNVHSLPTGSHIALKCKDKRGKEIVRMYTPTRFSSNDCEFIIRVYPDGKMTQYLMDMEVGQDIYMRGPTGSNRYGIFKPGVFSKTLKGRPPVHNRKVDNVVMLAGGTGITPMVQIANHIIFDPYDYTKGILIVANSTPKDVMMLETLDELESRSNGQIKVVHLVSRDIPGEDHDFYIGRISHQVFDHLGVPDAESSCVCICGPPGFERAAKDIMGERGYSSKQIIKW